jgi:anti-sigma factor RsiW
MQPDDETKRDAEAAVENMAAPLAQILTAYLDGELSEPARQAMDTRIAASSALQAVLCELEAGRALGGQLFDALLAEPLPKRLRDAARRAGGRVRMSAKR